MVIEDISEELIFYNRMRLNDRNFNRAFSNDCKHIPYNLSTDISRLVEIRLFEGFEEDFEKDKMIEFEGRFFVRYIRHEPDFLLLAGPLICDCTEKVSRRIERNEEVILYPLKRSGMYFDLVDQYENND